MERKHEYQTKSRQMILDYLIRNKDRAVHVSDIIRHMDQEECSVNKTTVYRYLDKLVAEKTLMKYVADKGEKAGYQYVEQPSRCQKHLHLQCSECGKVIHLDCDFMGSHFAARIPFYMVSATNAVRKKRNRKIKPDNRNFHAEN